MFLFVYAGKVKIVNIPNDIKVEENVFKETFVVDLSKQEIFRPNGTFICGEFIFYQRKEKPYETLVMNLNGKVLRPVARFGQGPFEINSLRSAIAHKKLFVLNDWMAKKIIVFDKNLNPIDEFRVKSMCADFIINNNDEIILGGKGSGKPYFNVYSISGNHLRDFGESKTTAVEYEKKACFDDVRSLLFIPEKNSFWACFKNRYDLRYYENEQLKAEIRAKPGFFKIKETMFSGRPTTYPADKPIIIRRVGNDLFYVYRMENKDCICDILDINTYALKRRIKLKNKYTRSFCYYKKGIFYALYENEKNDSLDLYKIEIPKK